MRERLIRQDRVKSFRWQVSSRISISQDGRLMDMVSDFTLRRDIYLTSKKESARRIWSGVATFHCSTDFAGNISASLTAMGQDTFFFPASVRLMVGWLNPRAFDICSCVIMVAIISYKMQCVKRFIAIYNNLLQGIENITNYSVEIVIKGGVW